MTLRPVLLAVLLLAGTTLASCGKQGDLEQPAPLFGAKAKADYEAKQKAKAEAAAAKKADKSDDADPYQSRPVEAPSAITEPNNPGANAPQGVLPDPLANQH
jgi:predicted small lipoprotein YifL